MIRIYHVPGTRSVRPVWLCFELPLEVEIVTVDFSPAFRDTPAWRAISPAGKVPALQDGDLTLIESGAICDYILDRYGEGRLRPATGSAERGLHQQWCWFAEASLLRPLGLARTLRAQPGEDLGAESLAKTQEALAVVDNALAGRDFLLGDSFSAADVMTGYSLALLDHHRVLTHERHPNAWDYAKRLRSRPAYVRAAGA